MTSWRFQLLELAVFSLRFWKRQVCRRITTPASRTRQYWSLFAVDAWGEQSEALQVSGRVIACLEIWQSQAFARAEKRWQQPLSFHRRTLKTTSLPLASTAVDALHGGTHLSPDQKNF